MPSLLVSSPITSPCGGCWATANLPAPTAAKATTATPAISIVYFDILASSLVENVCSPTWRELRLGQGVRAILSARVLSLGTMPQRAITPRTGVFFSAGGARQRRPAGVHGGGLADRAPRVALNRTYDRGREAEAKDRAARGPVFGRDRTPCPLDDSVRDG